MNPVLFVSIHILSQIGISNHFLISVVVNFFYEDTDKPFQVMFLHLSSIKNLLNRIVIKCLSYVRYILCYLMNRSSAGMTGDVQTALISHQTECQHCHTTVVSHQALWYRTHA